MASVGGLVLEVSLNGHPAELIASIEAELNTCATCEETPGLAVSAGMPDIEE